MIRIDNITSEHEQKHTIEFERGSVDCTLKFTPSRQRWNMDVLFTLNNEEREQKQLFGTGIALAHVIAGNKNWPFGFVCKDKSGEGLDPYKEDDFSLGRCELHFLTPDDMKAIRGHDVP